VNVVCFFIFGFTTIFFITFFGDETTTPVFEATLLQKGKKITGAPDCNNLELTVTLYEKK
ncbi:hypothetical protein KAH94_00035, partial [bacterium]|nr:hypothetical protein [bacterium]